MHSTRAIFTSTNNLVINAAKYKKITNFGILN
jgi:hypothetical protein